MSGAAMSFPTEKQIRDHFGGQPSAVVAKQGGVTPRCARQWLSGISKPSVVSFLSLCRASPGLWAAVVAYVEGDRAKTLKELDRLDAEASAVRARLGGTHAETADLVHDATDTPGGGNARPA